MSGRTTHCDALVVGSTLGGLVAANYLARCGLRVVLLEEEAKYRPVMREPFLLTGLQAGGGTMRVLRELALPRLEAPQIERKPVALQVILPEAWVDVPRGAGALASEIDSHGLAPSRWVRSWLEEVDLQAMKLQAELWDTRTAGLRSPLQRLMQREANAPPLAAALPPVPRGLEVFVTAQLAALSAVDPPAAAPAPALLLLATRAGSFHMPNAATTFRELLRRRLPTLHGEIHRTETFQLVHTRRDLGVELPRGRLRTRALLIAVPRQPLRRFLAELDEAPTWLVPGPEPLEIPQRLFRVERRSLPVAMAPRVIRADGAPESLHWLARHRDPEDAEIEWILASGPGAPELSADDPLGTLAPFSRDTILPVDPGPAPRWDREGRDLRFPPNGVTTCLRARPPILGVGPELSAGLGFEGEVLHARRTALQLANRLGTWTRMP